MIAAHGKAQYSTSRGQTGEAKRRSCGSWASFPYLATFHIPAGRRLPECAGIAEVMAAIPNTHLLAPISTGVATVLQAGSS